MQRFDRYWIGIVAGLLLPAVFCAVYMGHYHLWYMLTMFGQGIAPVLCKLLLLSVFPDMALIFVFYTTDTWRLSKGILAGAFPYLIAATVLTCF